MITIGEIWHTPYASFFWKNQLIPQNWIHIFDQNISTNILLENTRFEKINNNKNRNKLFSK